MKQNEIHDNHDAAMEHLEKWRNSLHELHYSMDLQDLVQVDDGDLVDMGIMEREMERILDELRKECGHRQKKLAKVIGERGSKKALQGSDPMLRGKRGSASPVVRNRPVVPKKGSMEYDVMLAALGVKNDAVRSHGVLSIHWEHASEYLDQLAEEGKNPPAGLSSKAEISATYRKKQS